MKNNTSKSKQNKIPSKSSHPKAPPFSKDTPFFNPDKVQLKAEPFFTKPTANVVHRTNRPLIQRGGGEVEQLLSVNAEAKKFFSSAGISQATVAAFTRSPLFSLPARQAVAQAWNIGKNQDQQVNTATERLRFNLNDLKEGENCTNKRHIKGKLLITMNQNQKNAIRSDIDLIVPLMEDVHGTFVEEPVPKEKIPLLLQFAQELKTLLEQHGSAIINCQAGRHRSVTIAMLCESLMTGAKLGDLYEQYAIKSREKVLQTLINYVKVKYNAEHPGSRQLSHEDWLKGFTA